MKPVANLYPFGNPAVHRAISEIIRRHSTNREDPRDFALGGTDLTAVREVLDLGCGFGFMVAALAGRLHPAARITGVDACDANEGPYLAAIAAAGYRGAFRPLLIDRTLPWPAAHFDLVLCTYALYFFVEALPAAVRVLHPSGRMLVLTHAENSFATLLAAAGVPAAGCALPDLIQCFCAGNAERLLRGWFRTVERRDYVNALRFGPADMDDLMTYVAFKLPLLTPAGGDEAVALASMRASIARHLAADGALVVEKDDACFWCLHPRPHGQTREGQR